MFWISRRELEKSSHNLETVVDAGNPFLKLSEEVISGTVINICGEIDVNGSSDSSDE